METSASFEVRSAPSPYPTAIFSNKFKRSRRKLIRLDSTLPFSCPFGVLALFATRRRIEQPHLG